MKKRDREFWVGEAGIILIAGWRRNGVPLEEIARRMGLKPAGLLKLKTEYSEMEKALERDREISDFLVEEAVFNKALSGDLKACELWLKARRGGAWGGETAGSFDRSEANRLYVRLGDLLREPSGRTGQEGELLNG